MCAFIRRKEGRKEGKGKLSHVGRSLSIILFFISWILSCTGFKTAISLLEDRKNKSLCFCIVSYYLDLADKAKKNHPAYKHFAIPFSFFLSDLPGVTTRKLMATALAAWGTMARNVEAHFFPLKIIACPQLFFFWSHTKIISAPLLCLFQWHVTSYLYTCSHWEKCVQCYMVKIFLSYHFEKYRRRLCQVWL